MPTDDWERLPPPCWGAPPDRTSTTTATSFSTSCTTGTWRPRPLLSHFRYRHGHPEPARSMRLISSWSLLRGTILVQWNAVILRVSLALRGQEDHRLVATQIALQPKSTVAVASTTFYSRDALRNPETAQQIHQFFDSVPPIPLECVATTCCRALFQTGAHCLGVFCSPFRSLGLVDPGPRSDMGRSTGAS